MTTECKHVLAPGVVWTGVSQPPTYTCALCEMDRLRVEAKTAKAEAEKERQANAIERAQWSNVMLGLTGNGTYAIEEIGSVVARALDAQEHAGFKRGVEASAAVVAEHACGRHSVPVDAAILALVPTTEKS